MIKNDVAIALDLVNAAKAFNEIVYLAIGDATVPGHTEVFRHVLQEVDDKLSEATRTLRHIERTAGEA